MTNKSRRHAGHAAWHTPVSRSDGERDLRLFPRMGCTCLSFFSSSWQHGYMENSWCILSNLSVPRVLSGSGAPLNEAQYPLECPSLLHAGMIQPANRAGGVRGQIDLFAQSSSQGLMGLFPSCLQLYPTFVLRNVCHPCALIKWKLLLGSKKWDWDDCWER